MFPDFVVPNTAVAENIHQLVYCCSLKGMFDMQFIFILTLYADFFIQVVNWHYIPTKPQAQPNNRNVLM
jgi:hypothetical protein